MFQGWGENETTEEDRMGNRVAGQIYDAMKAIQLFGYDQTITDMITTGNQFLLVGLCDQSKDSTPFRYLQNRLEAFRERILSAGTARDVVCGSSSTLSLPTVERSGKAESRPEEEARVIWGCQIVPLDHTECRNPKNVPAGEDTVLSLIHI